MFFWSSTGSSESYGSFETIVNPPLKSSKGTDHDDSREKTSPKSLESDIGVNLGNLWSGWSLWLSLWVKQRYHCVSWVRNDCAENTSQITWGECNTELSWLVVVFFSLGEDVVVEELDEPFESDELDDGVWNLSWPEWNNTFVHSWDSFLSSDFSQSSAQLSWVFLALSGELHFQFDGFPWAEQNISDDFSRTWGDWPSDFFVLLSVLLSDNVLVNILEDFVESELTESLSGVAD